jgi:hypothetical protein
MHERMLDKTQQPTDAEMYAWIGAPIAEAWTALRQFLVTTYAIVPTFDSGGRKYGWNLQHRAGGRPLCEMYPERSSFTALVVLGKKELEQALERIKTFGAIVQQALVETPRYHDGCWLYLRVSDPLTCQEDVVDIQQLVLIKKNPPKKKPALDG